MGWFGKSFEEKVADAMKEVRSRNLGVDDLDAKLDGEVVTLTGTAKSADVRSQVMQAFDTLVKTKNTVNQMRVAEATPAAAPAGAAAGATFEVPSGGFVGGPAEAALPVEAGQVESAATESVEAVPAEAGGERIHEVVSGDTLGGISKKYYGKASSYMKIFKANTDQLDNPDLIKVGQKLRIPE